jgi:hypothetical protein
MLYSAMLARKSSPISPSRSANSFRVRGYKTPLPQPLYNQCLQAPENSVHSTRLTTTLESAFTRFLPPNSFIIRTFSKHGEGGATVNRPTYLRPSFGGTANPGCSSLPHIPFRLEHREPIEDSDAAAYDLFSSPHGTASALSASCPQLQGHFLASTASVTPL